jgi:hypothetical protein
MSRIEREVGLDRVRAAAATADDALLPLDQQQLEVLAGSHGHLRPAVHALLAAIELEAAVKLLDDVSIDVLPKAWRSWVTEDGRVRRVRYELGPKVTASS